MGVAGSVFTAFLRRISAPRRYGRRQMADGRWQKAEGNSNVNVSLTSGV
ncbi:MAG: hypothetical protein RIE73_12820 [Coleofasciculus sp. C1-SOL-03]